MTNGNLPIVVGIGELCEPVTENLESAHSVVDLGASAAIKAFKDIPSKRFSPKDIDVIASTRPFTEYLTGYTHSFGKVKNLPRAIGKRFGCDPIHAVYEQPSGISPQTLLNEFSGRIASGEFETVLIVGTEVIANTKAAIRSGVSPDWSDNTGGQLEDRGADILEFFSPQEIKNDVLGAIPLYGLLENARRNNLKLTRTEYARKIGGLFEPFSRIAEKHPAAMFRKAYSSEEIATSGRNNPQLTDPYTIAMVAKDGVNQACAIVLTSEKKARELGIADSRWVYLNSYCSLKDRVILERKNPAKSSAMALSYQTALDRAGIKQEDISYFDLYSCFPIAVFNAIEVLGIHPDDPRGLTVTGGAAFFRRSWKQLLVIRHCRNCQSVTPRPCCLRIGRRQRRFHVQACGWDLLRSST